MRATNLPRAQFNLVQNRAVREKLQEDLRLPPGTLRYRWARATILMVSLRQMGAGVVHPLSRAAFDPLRGGFPRVILVTYRVLRQDVEALGANATSSDAEENLTSSVDNLLKRIYAYISWGIRHQADCERTSIKPWKSLASASRRPGAAAYSISWFQRFCLSRSSRWHSGSLWTPSPGPWAWPATSMSDSVVDALSPAIAASFIYGSAVFIALKRRSAQIERKIWREGSPRCLIPIAVRAGLVTWAVIIATTVVSEPLHTWQSLTGLGHALTSVIPGNATDGLASAESSFPTAHDRDRSCRGCLQVRRERRSGELPERRCTANREVPPRADVISPWGSHSGSAAGSAQLFQVLAEETRSDGNTRSLGDRSDRRSWPALLAAQ